MEYYLAIKSMKNWHFTPQETSCWLYDSISMKCQKCWFGETESRTVVGARSEGRNCKGACGCFSLEGDRSGQWLEGDKLFINLNEWILYKVHVTKTANSQTSAAVEAGRLVQIPIISWSEWGSRQSCLFSRAQRLWSFSTYPGLLGLLPVAVRPVLRWCRRCDSALSPPPRHSAHGSCWLPWASPVNSVKSRLSELQSCSKPRRVLPHQRP